jgi:hypothetical protein
MGKKSRIKSEKREAQRSKLRKEKVALETPFVQLMLDSALKAKSVKMNMIADLHSRRKLAFDDAETYEQLWPVNVYAPSTLIGVLSSKDLVQSVKGGYASDKDVMAPILERAVENISLTGIHGFLGLAAWRHGKGIYRFDHDFVEALAKTSMSSDMPVDVLRRLPEYGVYLEFPIKLATPSPLLPNKIGFIAFYDMVDEFINGVNQDTQLVESLVLLPIVDPRGLSEDGQWLGQKLTSSPRSIPLIQGKTAKECIRIGLSASGQSLDEDGESDDTRFGMYSLLLSMITYLCSERPDVEHNGVPRQPGVVSRNGPVAGFIQTWDVGCRIGKVLSDARAAENESDETGLKGNRPKPHLRAAHWHGYWHGPRDAKNRGYRLNWLPPTLVNSTSSDDVIPVIRDL